MLTYDTEKRALQQRGACIDAAVTRTNRNVIKIHAADGGRAAVGVDDAAKAAISKLADAHGMKEIAVVSRVYLWLARQTDDVLVKGVLGLLPKEYEAEVCKLALERLAKGKR